MFDNKQSNQSPPDNQVQGNSVDENLQNIGPNVNLKNINKDKEFPFKKVGGAPNSLQEPATEDIFSNTDKGEASTVDKPLDFNNQEQAPVVDTPPSLGTQGQQKENTNEATVEDLPPEVNLVQKTGKKSNVIMIVVIVCLAVVLLSLAGFWVYSILYQKANLEC
mgnify:FL=1